MKLIRTIAACSIIMILLMGYNQQVFSWGLFNLFNDRGYSVTGLKKVEEFNPEEDILYLPRLKGKNLFESVNDLSICRNKAVRKYVYLYLTTGRAYACRAIQNSYYHEEIVEDIFKKYPDVPREIALLPLLESGFNPFAVSRTNAIGLWQFVSATSRHFGLKKNPWIDERRDVEKSTDAAVRHLRNLYKIFNSWELTLAAYNGGAGHVKRAMLKTGTKNLWDLSATGALRKETEEYVQRYLALLLIYKNQRLFNIRDEIQIPEIIKTEKLTVENPVDLEQIAHVTGISYDIIKKINPELHSKTTPPYAETYNLHIPSDVREKIISNLDLIAAPKPVKMIKHLVKPGQSIKKIAKIYKKKPL
jgi:membrane-bound lytic murein transglycosylase D